VLGGLARIALYAAGAGLVLMTVFVAAQVFARYVLNSSLTWTEPASLLLMSWFIFLGAAVGVREGYHLSFDVLLHFLPPRFSLWLHTLSDIVVIAFGFGMVWYGTQLCLGTWNATLPSLGLPGGFEYMPVMAGGVLLIIFCLERIARRAAGMRTARFGEAGLEDA
jgi:TRAP-type C4-dicarboxylate transport system permease small subunit